MFSGRTGRYIIPRRKEAVLRKGILIANPVAGRGAAARALPRVIELLKEGGIDPAVLETSRPGDGRRFASRLAPDADLAIAVGGDGTVNEVVGGLIDGGLGRVPVGVIPFGTGNVVAKELGIPLDPAAAARAVADGAPARLDVGTAGGRYFLFACGAGFDAEVVRRFSRSRAGAVRMVRYVPEIVRALVAYDFPEITVELDGEALPGAWSQVLVANMRQYGGPLVVAAGADPSDGLLDVVLMRGRGASYLRHMAGAYLGGRSGARGVRTLRGKRVALRSGSRVPLHVDGDAASFLPVECGILPGAALLIRPPAHAG